MDDAPALEALARLEEAHRDSRADPAAAADVAAALPELADWPRVVLARIEAQLACDAILTGLPYDALLAHAKRLDPDWNPLADLGAPAVCAEAWVAIEPAPGAEVVAVADSRPRAFGRTAFLGVEGGGGVVGGKEGVRGAALARVAVWSWYRFQTAPVGGGLALQPGPSPALWAELRRQTWGWGASAGAGAALSEPTGSVRIGVEALAHDVVVAQMLGLEAWARYDAGAELSAGLALNVHYETRGRAAPTCGTGRELVRDEWERFSALPPAGRRAWNEAAAAPPPPPPFEQAPPLTRARQARERACEALLYGSDPTEWLREALALDPWFRYAEGDATPAICVERYEAAR